MPFRVILSYSCPEDSKYDTAFSIKVPRKYWDKEAKHLIQWFTEFYNKKFPERPLVETGVDLADKDGKIYPAEGIIQECFSHKQEIVLISKQDQKSAIEGSKNAPETKGSAETLNPSDIGSSRAAITLNSVVDMENPAEFAMAEERTENQYKTFKSNHGAKSTLTLKAAFRLMDICIAQYKLDRIDQILLEIKDACESKELKKDWYTKYIQMKAFCRWKQSKFGEALELFKEMKKQVGLSSKLLENMGHTYNSMGNYKEAQDCFQQALELVDVEQKLNPMTDSHKGGLFMGLGLVKKRQGNVQAGLVELQKALKWYQDSTGPKPHSLVAKAHMSVAHAHEDLKEWSKAAMHMELAVDIFQKTCGSDSPLTGNAQGSLGKVLIQLNKYNAAWEALAAAFNNEVKHDSLKVFTLFEHATLIYRLCTSLKAKGAKDAKTLVPALVTLDEAIGPQMEAKLVTRDGNVGALYKAMAEVAIVAQHYRMANGFLCKALTFFGEEKSFDCGSLIVECRNVLTLVNDLIRKGIGH